MRELKFRAWDKNAEYMVYSDNHDDDYFWHIGETGIYVQWYDPVIVKLTPDGAIESSGWTDADCIIMQYTGIKDKNGNEIYEGDIVQYPEYYFYDHLMPAGIEVIEWDGNGFNELLWFGYGNYPAWIEVIGNIYENPELIT